MGSKLNANLIDGGGSGGSTITNVNDLSNLLKDTTLKAISTWDDIVPSTSGVYFTPDTIPLKSPNNPPPYFTDWDYCVDIASVSFPAFDTEVQTVNFGKNRGTTQNVTLTYGDIGTRNIRAYFQIESYPTSGTFYKTPYVTSNFIYDISG